MAASESQLGFISLLSEKFGFAEASMRLLLTPLLGKNLTSLKIVCALFF